MVLTPYTAHHPSSTLPPQTSPLNAITTTAALITDIIDTPSANAFVIAATQITHTETSSANASLSAEPQLTQTPPLQSLWKTAASQVHLTHFQDHSRSSHALESVTGLTQMVANGCGRLRTVADTTFGQRGLPPNPQSETRTPRYAFKKEGRQAPEPEPRTRRNLPSLAKKTREKNANSNVRFSRKVICNSSKYCAPLQSLFFEKKEETSRETSPEPEGTRKSWWNEACFVERLRTPFTSRAVWGSRKTSPGTLPGTRRNQEMMMEHNARRVGR